VDLQKIKSEKISFQSDGLRLTGMIFVPEGIQKKPRPAICICPGIPRIPKPVEEKGYPALAQKFYEEGFVVLIFNLRGMAGSEGTYSLAGWSDDLRAAIDYLVHQPEVDSRSIGVLGFSGGAIVSIYNTANDSRIRFLIACSCPANIVRSSKQVREWVQESGYYEALRISNKAEFEAAWYSQSRRFNPISWIDKISPRPVLVVHGARDKLVTIENAHKLYRKAKEPKNFLIVEDVEHRIRESVEAIESIVSWVRLISSKQSTAEQVKWTSGLTEQEGYKE
jgi:fermentation-respiration switch protein FrsA (DUF1100 family)